MPDEKYIRKLRTKLDKALAKGRDETAIELLEDLEREEGAVPRWPHKRGDLLRKQAKTSQAIEAYERAVDLYAEQGFLARAVAMARTILDLNPARLDILERVDPQAARVMQQQRRKRQQSARLDQAQLTAGHPAVVPDAAASAGYNHPAIIPDDDPVAPRAYNHPAVLPDSAPPPAAQLHPAVLPDSAPPPAAQLHPAVLPDSAPPPAAQLHAAILPDSPPPSGAHPPPPPLPPRTQPTAGAAAPPPLPPRGAASVNAGRLKQRPITLGRLSLPPMAPNPQVPPPEASFFGPKEKEVAEMYSNALAGAQELAPAQDTGPDETRFDNVLVGQAAIEIDIGELEWAEPEEEPSADSLLGLPLFPLFGDVSKEALAGMVHGSEIVELTDGEHLVRRGDPGDALFGIVQGAVSVIIPGRSQPLVLGEGEVVGESCLLKDERRSADLLAKGDLTALRIPRDVLMHLVAEHPSVAEVLLRMLVRRLLGNLLQGSPLFEGLDGPGRAALAKAFETRRAAAGTVLAKAGKQMDGMYIGLTGTMAVARPNERPTVVGPGTLFGMSSLLSKEPSKVSVQARVNMVVLRLPASVFSAAAMEHPMILAKFSELAQEDLINVSN